jgi:NTE family protein
MEELNRSKTAVVFSGGGARGAYEAGMLLYIRERIDKQLGYATPIDIVTGTSVGAINAAFVAATMNDPAQQGHDLCQAWRSLEVENLMSLHAKDIVLAFRHILGGRPPRNFQTAVRYGGLIDSSGLENFVARVIPWRNIRHNLAAGVLQSLAVSTTKVRDGHSVVFLDEGKIKHRSWSRRPYTEVRQTRISPRHVLASASIPMLFASVRIGQDFYTDGGLRQNTPLAPALRLGADRILVISLRHEDQLRSVAPSKEMVLPRPLFLLGKMLNALLLDHTEYDLEQLERTNALIQAGTEVFGSDFQDLLNQQLGRNEKNGMRTIQQVHIRPSVDIGVMASDYVKSGRVKLKSRAAKWILGKLSSGESKHENDFLTYLMFDGGFASELIDLGYHDAAAHEEDLIQLFNVRT